MTMIDLNTVWFLLLGVLLAGYAVLDGFDLGVGVIHLFARNDRDRVTNLHAIGPVWDGNEVWLLTFGGALFAAFPIVYATVFSAYYIALVLVLAALIFRAVSIEFRGKVDSPSWKRFWDGAFFAGSLVPSLLFGVAVGNILRGLPLNSDGVFTGSFFTLLNPYSLLVGLVSLSVFTLHGALYMTVKTDGAYRDSLKKLIKILWNISIILFWLATAAGFLTGIQQNIVALERSISWVFLGLLCVAATLIPAMVKREKFMWAFLASSTVIVCMVGLVGVSLFPVLTPSLTDPSYSLTIYNASSTPGTLKVMLIIAGTGVPLVIAYTVFIYRVFKGKPVLDGHGY